MDCLDSEEEAFIALFMELNNPGSRSNSPMDTDSESSGEPDTDDISVGILRKPATSFLDLPDNVKILILKYTGLLRPCLVSITYEKSRIKQTITGTCSIRTGLQTRGVWATAADKLCDHPQLPMDVFLASREIRREIGSLFFAHNHFSITLSSRSDLQLFCTATEWSVEHLKNLHVELRPGDNRFLKLGPGVHRTILNMWSRFCKFAREKMPLLRCFNLKCRVKDLEVASRIMCAMDPFPVLSHCAFHFNHMQDDDIRPVLKRAALRLTGNLGDGPAFPFFQLPKEVQLLIIEQLLTHRSDPYIQASGCSPGIVTFQDRKRQRVNDIYPLTCCDTCSPLRSMCFCHARQTAFSTSCTCFLSPLPYFLVNREFYEDARRIFFSKNNFAFMEEDPDFMMRFMHHIPTSSFLQIRHLTFKLPASLRHPGRPGHRHEDHAMQSWAVLRRFIREHFDLSRLSITIVDLGTKPSFPSATSNRNKYLRKLLKSFGDLHGLRDFCVYLADDHLFERDAERAVLGPKCVGRTRTGTVPFIGRRH